MFVIISYDIVEDKRRNKISKMLENYGTRVQFSVFECLIDALQLKTIKEFAESILETSADSMRYYILCESCLKKVDIIGTGEITTDLDFYVVWLLLSQTSDYLKIRVGLRKWEPLIIKDVDKKGIKKYDKFNEKS